MLSLYAKPYKTKFYIKYREKKERQRSRYDGIFKRRKNSKEELSNK